MRRQFDRQIITKSGLVAERNRMARMEKPSMPALPPKIKRGMASSFLKKIAVLARTIFRKRLTDTDRWYIQRAAEKRESRKARNLRWWAMDASWHREFV
jgi:hypothetical protein